MVVNNGRLKRMRSGGNCRRRVTADLPDLFDFPAACDGVGVAPFRSSVRCFLERHARPTFTPSLFPCLMKWQILFRIGDLVVDDDGDPAIVALDIVEEDVTRSTSRSVYCDQCRVVGWSGHPVCRKRYHFIIRRSNGNGDDNGNNNGQLVQQQLEEEKGVGSRGHHKACTMCGNLLHPLDSRNRCKSCNYVITADEDDDDLVEEDWVYLQLEDTSHLLHGVVHSNGFGHLLTLNGREGGSTILSGRDIIDFWDKLCKTLAVRKVSVMDVSKKYGMEYRLLHAITNSHSWYSNWGYEFGAGSYALTLDAYRKAVQTLSNTPISLFYFQGRHRTSPTQLQALITFYQSISEEDSPFVSLRDLFSFILKLIHESHRSTTTTKNETRKKPKYTTTTTNFLCAWTMNDVESVEQAMIKVLLAAAAASDTPSWVSRRALKGALCKVTSPELLNYCLKHLAGKMAPNGMVVNSRCNPTSAVEFRLEPFGFVLNQDGTNSNRPSEEHLIHDLKFLYDCILYPNTMLSYRSHAKRELIIDSATKILDCKQFVKDYKPDKMAAATRPSAIYIWCHVEVADHPKDDPLPPPPPELLILPQNASVADLKLEATKAFQEVYVLFKRLEIDEVLDYGPLDDSMTLKLLVGSTGSIRVRGKCLGTHGLSRFRMERGTENWTVDCRCGAKDDDGERMLACDTCGIWQHTRCAGIDYYDAIPAKFVCMRCLNSYREASKDAQFNEAAKMGMLYSRTCRNEAATTNSSKLGSNLTITFGVPLM